MTGTILIDGCQCCKRGFDNPEMDRKTLRLAASIRVLASALIKSVISSCLPYLCKELGKGKGTIGELKFLHATKGHGLQVDRNFKVDTTVSTY